jgi:hypothetical protein
MIFDFLIRDLNGVDQHSAVEDQFATILVGHCLRPGIPLFCAGPHGGKVDYLGANTTFDSFIRKWFERKGPFKPAVRTSVTLTGK